jgi:hypothetical protein
MSECIEFQGNRNRLGYGRLYFEGRLIYAHRLAFFRLHGHWPPVVRHACDNPPCWNQAHLVGGTQADNVRDRDERKRGNWSRAARGSARPDAKLSEQDVIEIRKVYGSGGFTQSKLGKAYGVSESLIGSVVRREKWRHV